MESRAEFFEDLALGGEPALVVFGENRFAVD
jgi:hypothetical protein